MGANFTAAPRLDTQLLIQKSPSPWLQSNGLGKRNFQEANESCKIVVWPWSNAATGPRTQGLPLPSGRVRLRRQMVQQFKELRRLADEQSVCGKPLDCSHGRSPGVGGSNNRTPWKLPAQKWAGLRHDQAGFEHLP